jgi:uncharacterized protein (TIGR04255 family)
MYDPSHFPKFDAPPVEQVVLGVQFSPVQNFISMDAWRIWEIFKDDFPIVQEHPMIDPYFETFSDAPDIQPTFQFQVGMPVGSRFLFMSPEKCYVIQFQRDKFMINWHKKSSDSAYPGFEKVFEFFRYCLNLLGQKIYLEFDHKISINQVELNYVNLLPVDHFADVGKWLSVFNYSGEDIEGVNFSLVEVVRDSNNIPYARLKQEVQSLYSIDGGKKAYRMTLSFRGKPDGADIDATNSFLVTGHEKISNSFYRGTKKEAHKSWGEKE